MTPEQASKLDQRLTETESEASKVLVAIENGLKNVVNEMAALLMTSRGQTPSKPTPHRTRIPASTDAGLTPAQLQNMIMRMVVRYGEACAELEHADGQGNHHRYDQATRTRHRRSRAIERLTTALQRLAERPAQ